MAKFKLEIELVPKTTWGNNLRKKVPKKKWDELRRQIYAKYGHRCGICGSEGRMNCHELWSYDDKKHIQRLVGFIALCDLCHHVKHLGFASILASEGKLDYNAIIKHFMKVNNCNKATFEKCKDEAFTKWRERSKHKWKVDLGEYRQIFRTAANTGQTVLER
jgi:hypothetical protein